MAPTRTMTGDTLVSEKEKRELQSPASPTDTIGTSNTLSGDAIIEIASDDDNSTTRPSHDSNPSVPQDALPARPNAHDEKKPPLLKRITGSFKSTPDPRAITETITRKLEATPNGYPRLAAFQASEANFALYRSFDYLHSRILLDLQDEITSLEKELDEIDEEDEMDCPARLRSRELDVSKAAQEEGERNRRVILDEIRVKLMQYDEVLIKSRTLLSFQKPSARNYTSVRRYHHNTRPLMDAETDAIRTKEDIVSLRNGREWASFDGGVESLISRIDAYLQKLFGLEHPPLQRKFFRTPELQAKTTDAYISLYSSERVDLLVNCLITCVIFCLLVVPVVAMYLLTSDAIETPNLVPGMNGTMGGGGQQQVSAADINSRNTFNAVGVLIVFTLLFSAAMSLVTKAARHELFAASAAYCAILVVFIGNLVVPA